MGENSGRAVQNVFTKLRLQFVQSIALSLQGYGMDQMMSLGDLSPNTAQCTKASRHSYIERCHALKSHDAYRYLVRYSRESNGV
jgi:hypothetical protein